MHSSSFCFKQTDLMYIGSMLLKHMHTNTHVIHRFKLNRRQCHTPLSTIYSCPMLNFVCWVSSWSCMVFIRSCVIWITKKQQTVFHGAQSSSCHESFEQKQQQKTDSFSWSTVFIRSWVIWTTKNQQTQFFIMHSLHQVMSHLNNKKSNKHNFLSTDTQITGI